MAVVDEKKIREEIQKKRFRSLYYCYGEESFKLDHFLDSIRNALFASDGNSFNTEIFYGDELQVEKLLEANDSFSLWQGKKLLLVRNADRIPAKQQEKLKELVERPPEANIIVFLGQKVDARTKWIQSLNKAPEAIAVVHFELSQEWEFSQWARQFAKDAGKELEDGASRLLLEWGQGSLAELKHAVEKAALFASGQGVITEESVRAVNVRLRPESAFEFVAALLQQNRALALAKLQYLIEQGEEPLALLGLLTRQYRWLLAILAMRAEGKGETAIQSELRLYPKSARDLFLASKRLGSKGVLSGLKQLADADLQLKSTREAQASVLVRLTLGLVE